MTTWHPRNLRYHAASLRRVVAESPSRRERLAARRRLREVERELETLDRRGADLSGVHRVARIVSAGDTPRIDRHGRTALREEVIRSEVLS